MGINPPRTIADSVGREMAYFKANQDTYRTKQDAIGRR
jgi:hypothetical protein